MTDHDYWLEDMQAMKKRTHLQPDHHAHMAWRQHERRAHGGRRVHRHRIVADRQIRATRLKTSRWLAVPTNNQKSGCSAGYPRSLIRRPVGTITEYRYYPRAYELNTAQQIT